MALEIEGRTESADTDTPDQVQTGLATMSQEGQRPRAEWISSVDRRREQNPGGAPSDGFIRRGGRKSDPQFQPSTLVNGLVRKRLDTT